ncbi:MAG: hypothetical protein CVU49_09525 [Candidatus Cloacimonetes bacterium HGW-Cloacimonetes-2]|jgi:hypothetical protein|nr:MAG: hypothetical protein CVU49_09525 [Candidatus Cloacimonetes bacterium HGW-Cloacimonetes-2]
MSKRLTSILLLISLAFNLAVVGSMIFLKSKAAPPPFVDHPGGRFRPMDRFDRMERMKSDEGRPMGRPDRRSDDGSRFEDSAATRELRLKFRRSKMELMQELAKDPIDEARINTILTRSLTEQTALERTLGADLIAARKKMTAEEAEQRFGRRAEALRRRIERTENRRIDD